MRRRLTGNIDTGFGNPSPEIFDNVWTKNKEFNAEVRLFFEDVFDSINDFKDIDGFDFKLYLREDGFKIMFGVEPTYKHDPYICYCFDSNKEEIYIQKGGANGCYGSDIAINEEMKYGDGALPKEFIECVEKHYDKLLSAI